MTGDEGTGVLGHIISLYAKTVGQKDRAGGKSEGDKEDTGRLDWED